MKTIFVMVKCDLGRAYKVAEEAVETVEQVSEVYSISGQYDLLMKCYLPAEMDTVTVDPPDGFTQVYGERVANRRKTLA